MTNNISELLTPRVIVKKDYPFSPYRVDTVMHLRSSGDGYECRDNPSLGILPFDIAKKHPDIFEKLDWYEERTKEELAPAVYLKFVGKPTKKYPVGTVEKVMEWHVVEKGWIGGRKIIFFTTQEYVNKNDVEWGNPAAYVPTTEEEYIKFKNNS